MKPLAELCKPDRRQHGTVGTAADYHALLEALVLIDAVPDDVRTQFDVARNLMLYGWFVYEFYTVSSDHAYKCLELGLRKACEVLAGGADHCKEVKKSRGLSCYLTYLKTKGIIPAGRYHERIEMFLPMLRNDAAHGSDALLNFALAMPDLELVADLLNNVFSSNEVKAAQEAGQASANSSGGCFS